MATQLDTTLQAGLPRFGYSASIDVDAVNAAVKAEIVAAIEFANASTEPVPSTTMGSIYT